MRIIRLVGGRTAAWLALGAALIATGGVGSIAIFEARGPKFQPTDWVFIASLAAAALGLLITVVCAALQLFSSGQERPKQPEEKREQYHRPALWAGESEEDAEADEGHLEQKLEEMRPVRTVGCDGFRFFLLVLLVEFGDVDIGHCAGGPCLMICRDFGATARFP